MGSNPLTVALIIPTYNRSSLIGETIMAALNQRRQFDEIIVIDDGSTDETQSVVATYLGRACLIYEKTKNQGVQRARNRGVEVSSSDFVCFCDSDDLLQPEFLDVVCRFLETVPAANLIYGNFKNFSSEGCRPDKLSLCPFPFLAGAEFIDGVAIKIPDLTARVIKYQPFFPSGMTVRRSFFEAIGGFDPSFLNVGAEDWEFTLRAIRKCDTAFVCDPYIKIRRHESNDSAEPLRMLLGEIKILKYFRAKNNLNPDELSILNNSVRDRLTRALNLSYQYGRFDEFKSLSTSRDPLPFWGAKLFLKRLITMGPEPLRTALWKILQ